MVTCPYCANEINVMETGPWKEHAQCVFCEIILGPESEWGMYTTEHQRVPGQMLNEMLDLNYAKKSLYEIKQLHSCDLLLLLKLAREERSSVYNLLRVFNKAVEHGTKEFEENAIAQGGDYEYWTRRCWMLENLLITRFGYFPKQITNELILSMREKFLEAQKKPMKISKQKRSVTKS